MQSVSWFWEFVTMQSVSWFWQFVTMQSVSWFWQFVTLQSVSRFWDFVTVQSVSWFWDFVTVQSVSWFWDFVTMQSVSWFWDFLKMQSVSWFLDFLILVIYLSFSRTSCSELRIKMWTNRAITWWLTGVKVSPNGGRFFNVIFSSLCSMLRACFLQFCQAHVTLSADCFWML